MAEPAKQRMTYAEYLAFEEASELKHEFLDGEIIDREPRAMTGGTYDHAVIILNVGATLRSALRDAPCTAASSELRIRVPGADFAAYPDGSVICGPREHTVDDTSSASNPTVIVEVLSDSTERYDRGEKFRRYSLLSSFQTYVLVSQTRALVEIYERQSDDRWLLTRYQGLDAVARLDSVDVDLPLAEVYLGAEQVTAASEAAATARAERSDGETSEAG